jgi:hypothetical protein
MELAANPASNPSFLANAWLNLPMGVVIFLSSADLDIAT